MPEPDEGNGEHLDRNEQIGRTGPLPPLGGRWDLHPWSLPSNSGKQLLELSVAGL